MPPLDLPRQSSGNRFLGLLLIGGGFLILTGLAIVATIGWAYSAGGPAGGDLWREQLVHTFEESELPRSEKSELIAQVNRLAAECQSGAITRDELRKILERLEASPVFVAIDVGGIERDIVIQSGLSLAERQSARRTLIRAVRGVCAGKITLAEFYGALPPGYYLPAEFTAYLDQRELNEHVARLDAEPFVPASDDEVRQSLATLKKLADKAGVRAEGWSLDISYELSQAIAEAKAAAKKK